MRRGMILVLMTFMLSTAVAAPASAGGGVCIPSNDPYHKPPLCLT